MKSSKIFQKGTSLQLPLWSRVIFVDWHGVLSHDVFWESLLKNRSNNIRKQLSSAMQVLFTNRTEELAAWLRGELLSEDIIKSLHVRLPHNYKPDFLDRRLIADCQKMTVDSLLLSELTSVSNDSFLVLATDNMDCFEKGIERHWVGHLFDSILCSSSLGVLKSESSRDFFGPWLDFHGLSPNSGILIDDSAKNCRTFEDIGGTSILHGSPGETARQLHALLEG